jgi:hypothetical protein
MSFQAVDSAVSPDVLPQITAVPSVCPIESLPQMTALPHDAESGCSGACATTT